MLDLAVFSAFFDKDLPIYIGYSGGIDSHVLLHLCALARDKQYISNNLTAIHINHGISVNADSWQHHCQKICDSLNIKFIARKVKLLNFSENNARTARLEQFKDCIGNNSHNLAFAHHALDQAETVLFRLFRGTSIDGISGMRVKTNIMGLNIIRPLLNIDKGELIDYAKRYNLEYIVDESNLSDKYSRNYIRNLLIPIIQKRWPDAVNKINNFALQSADFKEIIDDNFNAKINHSSLSIDYLKSYPEKLQYYLLAQWLKFNHISASSKHLKILYTEVIDASISAKPQLKLSNKYIVRSYNCLVILDKIFEPIIYSCSWDANADLNLDFLNYTLPAKDYAGGGWLVKVGSYGAKVKKIFQENKIPPWERALCILLYQANKLVRIINTKNGEIIYQR